MSWLRSFWLDVVQKVDAPVTVKAPQSGSGGDMWDQSKITFNARAVLYVGGRVRSECPVPGGTPGFVELDAGQSGKVILSMKIHGGQDNLFVNEEFNQEFSVSWDVSADQSGTLSIETPQPQIGSATNGTYLRLESVNPDQGKSFVQVSPVIAGGADSGGISMGGALGREALPPKTQETFRLDILVHAPWKPEPKAPRAKIPPSLLTAPVILFDEDQDTLSPESIDKLQTWVNKVKDHDYLGAVVRKGAVPLEIQAFASMTGTSDYNEGETDRRLLSVKKILQNAQFFDSSALQFVEHSHGLTKADGKGPKNAFNRRVEVKIDHDKAVKIGS